MFWRTNVLQQLGGFDERFFMYGEDIDLCYRIQETGYHIDYVPETSIIHYKGESTKKGDLKYIRLFNKALYQFFDKQYSSQYSFLFKVFIYAAILVRTVLSFFASRIRQLQTVLIDLLILNFSLLLGFVIRFSFNFDEILQIDNLNFLWINALFSGLYFVAAGIFGLYKKNLHSISAHLKALILSYSGLILITFFARTLAYSRLIFAISFVIGILFTLLYRLAKINTKKDGESSKPKLRNSRVIIVGDAEHSSDIISKIHSRPDWDYEVIGHVSVKAGPITEDTLGSLSQLEDLVNAYDADQVFFALNSISYKQMLKEISNLQRRKIVFKLIPDSMDFILGKSNVEYLEAIPLVEVEFEYSKPLNKLMKRMLDISISLPVVLCLGLILWPSLLFSKRKMTAIGGVKLYEDVAMHIWKNRLRLFVYVLTGKLSLVGSPIVDKYERNAQAAKKGITGLVQISDNRIREPEEAESFSLYYLQNYSLWMDIDILIKTIFNGPYPISTLAEYEKS